MKHAIGDDKNNLAVLRALREDIVRKDEAKSEKMREEARWNSFSEAVDNISCACSKRNLGELASSVRHIKNLLRRPGVRKTLAQLEAEEGKKDDKKSEGSCSCAQCGKVIDGSVAPCAQGALCVDCAMKKRDVPPGEKEDKKDEKKAKKGTAFPPEMMGQGGGKEAGQGQGTQEAPPEEEPKQSSSLRKKKNKKKKNKNETNIKEWLNSNKRIRNEGKLRCRNYRMAKVFEDGEWT